MFLQVPSGQRCRTCPIKDDYFCPLEILLHGRRAYILWEEKCLDDGKTQGFHCCFCTKDFYGRIRRSRVLFVTFKEYEEQLGASMELLKAHQNMIATLIDRIIDSGGKMSVHMNWREL